ncbi:septation ring formation regulator EzrA [Periweissella beninensis]|uniref:septation ring formation regulator EzrA n=1 Tax=Periweissella beninensis TaxID=504936 RepID=UPI0021A4571D|nr:septation ring formation regulator EzrA [Periweissella beninensis]MCT4395823.1 hypothetical protein [Periweissella beninensis]
MTSSLLKVVIGIFVIAIIIYIVIFVIQRMTVKKVSELQLKKQKLTELDTKDELKKSEKLSLTGKSLKKFQEIQKKYQDIEKNDFKEFDRSVDLLLFDVKGWNIVKTQQQYHQLELFLDEIANKIVEVRQELEALKAIDEAHRQAVRELEGKYQFLRKELLTKNFEFGDSIDKLEEMLASLEDDFDEFTQLTNQGDHTAATDIYDQLNDETKQLEMMIEQIPAIRQQLSIDFPAQINELKSAHQQLLEDGYLFEDQNIAKNIDSIDASRVIASNLLDELEIDEAKAATSKIAKQIDGIYSKMQAELDAKKEVKRVLPEVSRFIEHAKRQNHLLLMELDRLGQRYILTNQEIGTTHKFGEEIEKVSAQYRQIMLDVQFNKAIYTSINYVLNEIENKLTKLEEEHQKIWNGVASLNEREQNIKKILEQSAFKLRDIKRSVEQMNLPGLSQEYRNQYEHVNYLIGKLDQDIQAIRIDIDDVEKKNQVILKYTTEIEQLTNDMQSDARLAEQLLQYANRYRLKNQQIGKAYQAALVAYQEQYDYKQAQSVLGKAIEMVEPGVYQKLKDSITLEN